MFSVLFYFIYFISTVYPSHRNYGGGWLRSPRLNLDIRLVFLGGGGVWVQFPFFQGISKRGRLGGKGNIVKSE